MKHRQQGFNILELMVVVSIVGVLLAFGIPALGDFMQSSRMTTTINELVTTVLAGNAEALKRRSIVTVCHSTTYADAKPTCDTTSGAWEDGWVVFADANGDTTVDNGDDVILRHAALAGKQYVVPETGLDFFQFTSDGRIIGDDGKAVTAHLLVCDERGNADAGTGYDTARAMLISRTGRAVLFKEKSYIDALSVDCN